MKLLLALGLTAGLSVNAFAWSNISMQANVCNKTINQTFEFEQTGAYQADTSDSQSAKFTLTPGQCHGISYWFQYKAKNFDYDDTIEFTDQVTKGKFSIIGINHGSQGSGVGNFDMEGFNYHINQYGYYDVFYPDSHTVNLAFDLTDAFPEDSASSAQNN